MTRRAVWVGVLLALGMAPAAHAQPRLPSRRTRPVLHLAARAAEGVSDMAAGRLDRWSVMAVEHFDADDPADDGLSPADPRGLGPVADPVAEETDALVASWTGGGWSSCGLDGDVEPVDLHTGNLTAVQVALASRGSRAVALVTLGRPAGGRQGMVFPESRWVEWDAAQSPRVSTTPGFQPDAEMALGDREASVLSYVTTEDDAQAVALTTLGAHGVVDHPTRTVPDTTGMTIDSNLVAWAGGVAAVLDHQGAPGDPRTIPPSLYFLDRAGTSVADPAVLTHDAHDDTLPGRSAGVSASPDGHALTVAWSVPSGPHTGVWARRGVTLTTLPAPVRLTSTAGLFAPQPVPGGVVFHRLASRDDGAPTELGWQPFDRTATARILGTWWDPGLAWAPAGPVVVGQRHTPQGDASDAVFAAHGTDALRPAPDPHRVLSPLADAVDVAVAPLPTGAVVAWIQPDHPDDARRHLALARVACVSAPAASPTVPAAPVHPPLASPAVPAAPVAVPPVHVHHHHPPMDGPVTPHAAQPAL